MKAFFVGCKRKFAKSTSSLLFVLAVVGSSVGCSLSGDDGRSEGLRLRDEWEKKLSDVEKCALNLNLSQDLIGVNIDSRDADKIAEGHSNFALALLNTCLNERGELILEKRYKVSLALSILEFYDRAFCVPFRLLKHWCRSQLGIRNARESLSDWQRGGYDYLVGLGDLNRKLKVLGEFRGIYIHPVRDSRYYLLPVIDMERGMFSSEAVSLMSDLLKSTKKAGSLAGKTVAVVPCGCQDMTNALLRLPDTESPDKIISVDYNPEYKVLFRCLAKNVSSVSKYVDMRLQPWKDDLQTGLDAGECDLIIYPGPLCFGLKRLPYSQDLSVHDRASWLRSAYAALKPGGKLIIYDSIEFSSSPGRTAELAKQAGFSKADICYSDFFPNGAEKYGEYGYCEKCYAVILWK